MINKPLYTYPVYNIHGSETVLTMLSIFRWGGLLVSAWGEHIHHIEHNSNNNILPQSVVAMFRFHLLTITTKIFSIFMGRIFFHLHIQPIIHRSACLYSCIGEFVLLMNKPLSFNLSFNMRCPLKLKLSFPLASIPDIRTTYGF